MSSIGSRESKVVSVVEWESFAQGLAQELASLPDGALVVISEPGEGGRQVGRYVQFAQEADRLTAELVGNSFLLADQQASTEGEHVIARLGWRPGTAGHENWGTELAWPASDQQYQSLVEMVVEGLRDGYGIADPGVFRYEAWNKDRNNEPITLSGLGLPAAP